MGFASGEPINMSFPYRIYRNIEYIDLMALSQLLG